jgi:TonB family protein
LKVFALSPTLSPSGRGRRVLLLALLGASAFAQQVDDVIDAGVDVVPPQLIQPSPAAFPEDAGVSGEVELLLTIDTTGAVIDVTVQSSTGQAFTDSAVTAARGLAFEPATQHGAPVSVVLAYRYRFETPVVSSVDAGEPARVGRLTGRVLTRGTRETISLAQVGLEDGGVTPAETDAEGRFTLEIPPGPQRVQVTASGHVPRVFKEKLEAGQTVEVLYRLNRTFSRPYETVVRGQVDRAELSRITLSGAELHEVAGTNGEPLRVIMLLPGVVTPASGLSYPVVRGALPAATGFYLDGVRVPQLYHLLAGGSVVHPDFIESIDFYPANAPTRFGRISGGVISAQVAKARDDRVHFTVSPDLLQTSAFVEVPIEKTGTNITVGGHISYAAWLLAALSGAGAFGEGVTPVFESWDYQARIEQKVGKGSVRLLAFGSSDLVGTRQKDPKSPSVFLTSRFHRIDLRGQYPVGPGSLELGSFVGWETLGLYGEQNNERVGSFLLNRFILTGRATYRLELGGHWQVKAGFDVERQVSDVETTIGIGAGGDLLRQPRVMGVFTGTFLEAAFFSEQWTVIAGARLDTWHLSPSYTLASVDPRFEVRFKPLEALTLRGTAGLAHQSPMLLISLPVTDVGALRSGLQEVGQFSVGAVGKLPWFGMELSGDVFLNHIFQARERSLAEFVTGISSLDDRFSGNRYGRAYGLELMLRLPQQGRLFGWLSYSLMRSERLRRFAIFNADQSEVTDATAMVPFAFDQAHSLNLVLGYQLPKGFKVSAAFHLNTGRPESGEFSSRTQRLVDDPASGRQLWSLVPLNEVDRLPVFGRLDLRASKTISFNNFMLDIYLDVFNVLVRSEVYGFTYGYGTMGDPNVPTKRADGAPIILPTLGVKVVY